MGEDGGDGGRRAHRVAAVLGTLMGKGRLEAFSDGVIAVIITIMVLEMKVPHGTELASLLPLIPVFLSYVLSFIYVGIYWNNHHHMLHAVQHVTGAGLWANLHLLFWLSLIPFVTGWMSENHFQPLPVAVYGIVLFMSGFAYFIFERVLVRSHGADSQLSRALGARTKEIASVLIYGVAIPLAFWQPFVACALYMLVAVMWLYPDPRFERLVAK
jgi:TMEM175 potassium channel family protein